MTATATSKPTDNALSHASEATVSFAPPIGIKSQTLTEASKSQLEVKTGSSDLGVFKNFRETVLANLIGLGPQISFGFGNSDRSTISNGEGLFRKIERFATGLDKNRVSNLTFNLKITIEIPNAAETLGNLVQQIGKAFFDKDIDFRELHSKLIDTRRFSYGVYTLSTAEVSLTPNDNNQNLDSISIQFNVTGQEHLKEAMDVIKTLRVPTAS